MYYCTEPQFIRYTPKTANIKNVISRSITLPKCQCTKLCNDIYNLKLRQNFFKTAFTLDHMPIYLDIETNLQ